MLSAKICTKWIIGRTKWIIEYFSYLALVEYCTMWICNKWGHGVPLRFPSIVFFYSNSPIENSDFWPSFFCTVLMYFYFQAYFLNWENWVQVGIIINVLLISFHTNPMESLTEPIHLIEPWQHHAAAIGVFLGKFGRNKLWHWVRDANSLAIFIPRGFGEWGIAFFHSGNLESIPRGPLGIFGELDPLKWAILSNRYDT